MSYAELHFHLLPAVDDGPPTMEMTIALARAAVADGTGIVVATPHVHPAQVTDPIEIIDRVRECRESLRRESIALSALPGGELAHDMVPRLSDRQLETIAQGPAGRRWVLLEAPFDGLDDDFADATDELRARGLGVVIAHPERARQTMRTAELLEREIAAGAALQFTAGSFVGMFGERTRRDALRLLRRAPIAILASDAHGVQRLPSLRAGLDRLTAAGERGARRLTEGNPRTLLAHGLPACWQSLVA